MMLKVRVLVAASVAALVLAPALAQEGASRRSRARDAYAKQFGVAADEARRRLELQREAGRLRANLVQQEGVTFGGMYIEYTPQFRIVVRFTGSPQATLARYTQNPSFHAELAENSYDALLQTQSSLRSQLRTLGINSESQVLENTGRVEFFVVDVTRVRGLISTGSLIVPAYVQLTQVPTLERTGEARIEGGRRPEQAEDGHSLGLRAAAELHQASPRLRASARYFSLS